MRFDFYNNFRPAPSYPNCFCEQIENGIIAQTSNTLSLIPVILFGVYLIIKHKDRKNIFPFLIGLSTVILGIGSMLLHATITYFGAMADWLGMYMTVFTLMLWSINNTKHFSRYKNIAFLTMLTIIFMTVSYHYMFLGRIIFALALLITMSLEIYTLKCNILARKNLKYFITSIILMLISYFIHQLDERRIICNPVSIVQLHSIWHILIIPIIYFFYKYKLSLYLKTAVNSKETNAKIL